MSKRDAAAQRALAAGPDAIRAYLKANDTEGFGCACVPGFACGPCTEWARQGPLRAALAGLAAPQAPESKDAQP